MRSATESLKFAAIPVLIAMAWLFVWRYGAQVWYSDRSGLFQVLMPLAIILWFSIPLFAVVRLVAAIFSEPVRNSIASHKLLHVMWWILAMVMTFVSLAPFLLVGKTKG